MAARARSGGSRVPERANEERGGAARGLQVAAPLRPVLGGRRRPRRGARRSAGSGVSLDRVVGRELALAADALPEPSRGGRSQPRTAGCTGAARCGLSRAGARRAPGADRIATERAPRRAVRALSQWDERRCTIVLGRARGRRRLGSRWSREVRALLLDLSPLRASARPPAPQGRAAAPASRSRR